MPINESIAAKGAGIKRKGAGIERTSLGLTLVVLVGACADGGSSIRYEPIPPTILTPDRVETRLGTLEFFDGYPNLETVAAVYDDLDFRRGVRAFLDALPIASLHAMREGLREVGAVNGTVGIFENLMDSRTLFLTANTESVYAFTWLDLNDGPMVVESAPNTLCILDDFWFGHVTDLGNVGCRRLARLFGAACRAGMNVSLCRASPNRAPAHRVTCCSRPDRRIGLPVQPVHEPNLSCVQPRVPLLSKAGSR